MLYLSDENQADCNAAFHLISRYLVDQLNINDI